jgi:dTDP-4-dehydrorhamnose 3,5-epimerase-like enzyme
MRVLAGTILRGWHADQRAPDSGFCVPSGRARCSCFRAARLRSRPRFSSAVILILSAAEGRAVSVPRGRGCALASLADCAVQVSAANGAAFLLDEH